jgi:hypothetical protein
MPGSLLALVAKSDEDKFLTGNPQITFWRSSHKRYTNFAIQRYQISRPSERVVSSTIEFKIDPIGDILRGATLEIALPAISDLQPLLDTSFYYTDLVGCAAIDRVEFMLNGQVIQTLWGDWIAMYQLLVEEQGKQEALNDLRGGPLYDLGSAGDLPIYRSFDTRKVVRIPLPFFFARESGAAVPIVGLSHSDIRFRVFLRPFDQILYAETDPTGAATSKFYTSVQLYVDVVHLDREERAFFTSTPQEYLIEIVQRNNKVFTNAFNQLSGRPNPAADDPDPAIVYESLPLQLSLPVKELFWVLEPQPRSRPWCDMSQNRWLEFPLRNPSTSAELIKRVSLRIAGQSVFDNERAEWFRLEQPIRYHSNVPIPSLGLIEDHPRAVYVHSFALRPQDYNPSGTLNFSAVDKAELILGLTKPDTNYNVVCYAWGYNILRIGGGIGGLAYTY